MSKAQILEEVPKLSVSDHSQLFARLADRQALDEAHAEFERDPSPGQPWRDALREICLSKLPV